MNLETLLEHYDKFVAEQREVLIKKNSDYAKEGDVFHNFKASASTTGITPAQGCLNQLCIKTTRLGALMSPGKEVQNEPVIDSVKDAFVYSFLLHEIISEGSEAKNQIPTKGAYIVLDCGIEAAWPTTTPLIAMDDTPTDEWVGVNDGQLFVMRETSAVYVKKSGEFSHIGTLIIK